MKGQHTVEGRSKKVCRVKQNKERIRGGKGVKQGVKRGERRGGEEGRKGGKEGTGREGVQECKQEYGLS